MPHDPDGDDVLSQTVDDQKTMNIYWEYAAQAQYDRAEENAKLMLEHKERGDRAIAMIHGVRALHAPVEHEPKSGYLLSGGYGMVTRSCKHCSSYGEYAVEFPCDTIDGLSQIFDEHNKSQK